METLKKQINDILKKYGLEPVKKQNGRYEKTGFLRYHEKLKGNVYGFQKEQFRPTIDLFVETYYTTKDGYKIGFSYANYIGAWDDIILENFDPEDLENDIKEFIKDCED